METSLEPSSATDSSLNSVKEKGLTHGKKFKIILQNKIWRTIVPNTVEYRREKIKPNQTKGIRKYFVLQPGLRSGVLSNKLGERKDIPCNWINIHLNKRNKCFLSGTKFIEIFGKCTECTATNDCTRKT